MQLKYGLPAIAGAAAAGSDSGYAARAEFRAGRNFLLRAVDILLMTMMIKATVQKRQEAERIILKVDLILVGVV